MTNFITQAMDLLVTAGVGTRGATSGWGIYAGKEPKTPHTTVTLFATGGLVPNPKWLLDEPTFQVRVRGTAGGYEAAFDKAVEVKDALLGLPSQTIGTTRWVSVLMPNDITNIGYDENERPRFTLNFRLILEPATGTNRVPL